MDLTHCISESPVEAARKEGPRGDGNWPGFDRVYRAISQACDKMGARMSPGAQPDEFHVATMADLGSGHEERMKGRLQILRACGWL